MSVIVETLNIGFIIPLIDFECDLKLTLADKGILSASAFAGLYYFDRACKKFRSAMLVESFVMFSKCLKFKNLQTFESFKNSVKK